jgi:two-component system chemotaxis sensor kinase CheA
VDPAKYAELFLTESREQLVQINEQLLALERAPEDTTPVAALFRAVHSLKGMAATMGFSAVASLAHELETLMDGVRAGQVAVEPVVSLLFEAADGLERAVGAAVAGRDEFPDRDDLLGRLRTAGQGGDVAPVQPIAAASPQRRTPARTASAAPMSPADGRTIKVTLEADTPLRGVRAFLVVQRARALGELTAVWPPVEALQAEQFDREFSLKLVTSAAPDAIAADLAKAGYVERVLVDVAPAPVAKPTPTASAPAPTVRSVRVDTRRLDALLNLVGELVIARDRLTRVAAQRQDAELSDVVAQTERLIGNLHDEILASRLIPVWQVFDRFPRTVRDAAKAVGKEVEFVVEGKEIELDRSLLEELADPVVHLLRNAVDHGLETAADRRAAGKPATGRLVLSASRDRSAVLVKVEDDGRGIDRRRVIARAAAEGLVEADRTTITDDELVKLIARPGFSTAERVTGLSGRGVGIDAVIAKVRGLGGSVEIRSVEGRGTTIELRLPVTLAIVGAVLAQVGDERYALPMTHVQETVELAAAHAETLRGREVMTLREDVLPLVHLRDVVRMPRRDGAGSQVVIVERAERRAGLVVDRLLGQQDIVVKPLDAVRNAAALFSGATILSDGAPALILDVNTLL